MNQVTILEPSKLPIILAKCEEAWNEARAVQDTNLVAVAPTFKGLCDMSNFKSRNLLDALNKKDRKPEIELRWMNACSNNPTIQTDRWVRDIPCDFEGWTVGTSNQKIVISTIISDAFAIPYMVYDNAFTAEDLYQEGWMLCIKGILEKANQLSIAKLIAFSGYNKMQVGMGVNGSGNVTPWKITKVPYKNLYPSSLNSYVSTVMRMNKMVSPKMFCGGALEVSEFVEGSLEQFKFGTAQVYSDLENFSSQGVENDIFAVSRGAIGVLNTWNYELSSEIKWDEVKLIGADSEMYFAETLPAEYSPNGRQLVVDVTKKFVKKSLAENQYGNLNVDNRCEWVEVYNVELKLEIVLNPLACQELTTGIVRLRADNALPAYLSPTMLTQTVQIPIS